MNSHNEIDSIKELIEILKTLRAPGGCPWDQKQTLQTLAPLILEEAFEVVDAIESQNMDAVSEELGDLSMNVLMTCLIAQETQAFPFDQAFKKISQKIINRHPHVFGDKVPMDEEKFLKVWDQIKSQERKKKKQDASAIAGIPKSMPALMRCQHFIEKARRTGARIPALREMDSPEHNDEASMGQALFQLTLICAKKKINPELALRAYVADQEQRFRFVEENLDKKMSEAAPEEIGKLWEK